MVLYAKPIAVRFRIQAPSSPNLQTWIKLRDSNRVIFVLLQEVAEAYEVLSDKKKRDIYDQFGEEGLKGGAGGGSGGSTANGPQFSYTFTNVDPRQTFAQFFGTESPFEIFFGGQGLGGAGGAAGHHGFFDFGDDMDVDDGLGGFGGLGGRGPGAFRAQSFAGPSAASRKTQAKQDPPIEHDLHVSLEEVLKGCTKRMKITRRVVGPDGKMRKEDKVLTINVKPGWKVSH